MMKKTILMTSALSLILSATTFAQRDDKGLNFGGTVLPSSVQSLSDWEIIPEVSDDFNYANKSNSKFTDTWAEAYLPDPGFVGPGQTRWVQRGATDAGDPGVVKVNGTEGVLEVRAYPGENNPASTSPKLDRFIQCGIVTAKTQVKYPIYMESRIKISNIENSSNFWLLNACDNEEIDILECYGGSKKRDAAGNVIGGDNKFYSAQMSTNFHIWHRKGGQTEPTLSGLENCGGGILTDFTYQTFFTPDPTSANYNTAPNWRDAYHTFGMLWTSPTDITYYLDGVPRNNGSHFVNGRIEYGLTGSFEDAKLQCPVPSGAGCQTSELLADVQGMSSGGSPFPNRRMDDSTFIIIDTESHLNKPLEDIANLNDDTKNVIQVDWVRVYKPVGVSTLDRTLELLWDNLSDFKTSTFDTNPIFEAGETIDILSSYQTTIESMVEQGLNYVAIQIREFDETGTPIKTSPFETVLLNDAPSKNTTTINYTFPTHFDAAGTDAIPTVETLDAGHKLMMLFFMQQEDGSIANQNTDITLTLDKDVYLSESLIDNVSSDKGSDLVNPNPFSEKLTILKDFNKGWELYDFLGRVVAKGTEKVINGTKLTPGIYVLVVDGTTTTKVIKK